MITKIANEFLKEAANLSWIPGMRNFALGNRSRQLNNLAGAIKNQRGLAANATQAERDAANAAVKNAIGDSRYLSNKANLYNNYTTEQLNALQNNLGNKMWSNYAWGAGKLGLTGLGVGGALWGGNKLLFGGNPAPAAPQMQRAAY